MAQRQKGVSLSSLMMLRDREVCLSTAMNPPEHRAREDGIASRTDPEVRPVPTRSAVLSPRYPGD